MFKILPALYERVADMIIDSIGRSDYLSESLEFEFEDVECRLVFSAIIYRQRLSLPEGECDVIDDVVPVWWEFHTVFEEGERLNDFSFSELRRYFK